MTNYTQKIGGGEALLISIPTLLFLWGAVTGHFMQMVVWFLLIVAGLCIVRFLITLWRILTT